MSDNVEVLTSGLGTILQGSLCVVPPHLQQAQHPNSAFSDVIHPRLRATASPVSPRWHRVQPLPSCSAGICPARHLHLRFSALACAWRPPQTRQQTASRDPAKGRSSSDARPSAPPPLRAAASSKGVAGQGPQRPADKAQAPSDHFLRELAIP